MPKAPKFAPIIFWFLYFHLESTMKCGSYSPIHVSCTKSYCFAYINALTNQHASELMHKLACKTVISQINLCLFCNSKKGNNRKLRMQHSIATNRHQLIVLLHNPLFSKHDWSPVIGNRHDASYNLINLVAMVAQIVSHTIIACCTNE